MFVKGTFDEKSFLGWFENRLRASPFEVNHIVQNDGLHHFVVKHDMGWNWSLFHKMIIEQFFDTMKKDVKIETQENMFIIDFSL